MARDFQQAHGIKPIDFRMEPSKGRKKCKRQAADQDDGGQAALGHGTARPGRGKQLLRAMPAGMKKPVLEGPVLSQIIPTVVFILPVRVPELAKRSGGDVLLLQGGDPDPLLGGGFGLELSVSIMALSHPLLGAEHAHGLRIAGTERQSLFVPEIHWGALTRLGYLQGGVGRARPKKPQGILIQIPIFWFQGDDQVPSPLAGPLQNRLDRVQRVEHKRSKKRLP